MGGDGAVRARSSSMSIAKGTRARSVAVVLATVLAVGTLAVTTALADYAGTVLSQGPAGYWRLTEATQPAAASYATNLGSAGVSGRGTFAGALTRGVAGALAGDANTAVSFGASDDSIGGVLVGNKTDWNPPTSFSVEAWVRTDRFTDFVDTPLASLNVDGANRNGWLFYLNTNSTTADNRWQFRMGNTSAYIYQSDMDASPSVVLGTWYHLVGVFDSTSSNASFYIDGKLVHSAVIDAPYVPNASAPLTIGIRSDLADYSAFYGSVDEVAIYPDALSAARVLEHYRNGTNANRPASYPSVVQADNPVGYWRLDEPEDPPLPAAANAGTLGPDADGYYVYGVNPGQPGPRPPALPGFDGGNNSCGFGGQEGFVTLPALGLNTNTVTITCWLKLDGTQPANCGIVLSRAGTTTAGLKFDPFDPDALCYEWNNEASASNFKSTLVVPESTWAFAALVIQPDQAVLCLQDGNSFTCSTNYMAHVPQAFEGPTLLGNDSADSTVFFKGSIDEVAVFGRSLSIGEVYSQYASAKPGIAPVMFWDPQTPDSPLEQGGVLRLFVDAGGTPPLTYQWRKEGVAIPGATGPIYSKAGLVLADAGNYDVVVKSSAGTVTSQMATIQVSDLVAPWIAVDPQGRTVYQGGTVRLSVEASGGGLRYQWRKDGSDIPGATQKDYVISSAQAASVGNYQVVVRNDLGTANSATANVKVLLPSPGTYEEAVLADGPESWYRLDESVPAALIDGMGRHDGAYQGGVEMRASGALQGNANTAATFDGASGLAEVPYTPDLNTSRFTIECWAKAPAATSTRFMCPVASFNPDPGRGYLLIKSSDVSWWYVYGDATDDSIYYIDDGTVVYDRWNHLVATYDGANYAFYLNGQFMSVADAVLGLNTSQPFRIGVDMPGGNWNDFWEGQIDEVAYYRAPLSSARIAAHYAAGVFGTATPPTVVQSSTSETVAVTTTVVLISTVSGSLPIDLQWTKDGVAVPGATNRILRLNSAQLGDSGLYRLVATNKGGTAISDPVSVTVLPSPTYAHLTDALVLHLPLDGSYTDTSGKGHGGTPVGAPRFVAGRLGQGVRLGTDTTLETTNYITLGVPADLKFGPGVNFSVSLWVRVLGSPRDLPFFADSEISLQGLGVAIAPAPTYAGGWGYSLYNADGAGVYGEGGAQMLNDGKWHSFVVTFGRAASGNANAYVDGVRVDQQSLAGIGDILNDYPINLGQSGTADYGEPGQFELDDVGVWRRELSYYDAQAIFAAGSVYGRSFDVSPAPVIGFGVVAGNKLQLSWSNGVLQSADVVTGPWSDVSGNPPSPYTVTSASPRKFYRLRVSGQ